MQFPNLGESAGGKYVKMKSGERVVGLFVGDPVTFEQHWVDNKSAPCKGAGCDYCKAGDKPATKFQMNFMTQEDGVWMAKVFEGSKKTLKTMENFHKEYDLDKTLVTVTKQGERTATIYSLLPAKTNLTDDELKKVKAIPLNKLGKQAGVAPTVVGTASSNY